jgi:glutathione S-transferase
MEASVSNKAFGFVVPPEREASVGYGNFDRVMKVLEEAVSGSDYLVGNSFTAADVYVGSHIGFGLMFGTIEKRPAFERYVARLGARPAFARAQKLDEALMAPQQAAS